MILIATAMNHGHIVSDNSGYCGRPLCALLFPCMTSESAQFEEMHLQIDISDATSKVANEQARQFDFLEGEWDAICRFPLSDGSWVEGPGSLKATKVLDGCVSLEFFEGRYREAFIKGLGLRAFNPRTFQWEHTWTDTSAPGGFLVWRGRFEGGAIDLHGEWVDETGQHILSRLTWSRITERSANWVSHRSLDRGKSWTKHWEIDFVRRI